MLWSLFFIFSLRPWANPPSLAKKPVSVSYEAVVRCYPELKDDGLSFRVDLDRLRERIDAVFVTERSRLQSRVVKFRDADGSLRRLRLENKEEARPTFSGTPAVAHWETLRDDGSVVPWEDPSLKKVNPGQLEISTLLARGKVESDDRVDVDTKLKGLKSVVRREGLKVIELRLEDTRSKKVLSCQDKPESGPLCLCLNK